MMDGCLKFTIINIISQGKKKVPNLQFFFFFFQEEGYFYLFLQSYQSQANFSFSKKGGRG
jgi:hypothetical protein